METPRNTGLIESLLGSEPSSEGRYRLPFGIAVLILLLALLPFGSDGSLIDLFGPAVGAYITLQAIGDRVWSRSIGMAAWLRLVGILAMFAGISALALHSYIEQQWIEFAFLSLLCAAFVGVGAYKVYGYIKL